MDYGNGFNEEEQGNDNQSMEPNQVPNTYDEDASPPQGEDATPVSRGNSGIVRGVKNKAKHTAKTTAKNAIKVIGAAIKKVILTVFTKPVILLIAIVLIIVLAAIIWILGVKSKDTVIKSTDTYVQESAEALGEKLVGDYNKKKSFLSFKISDIDNMYQKFLDNQDDFEYNTYKDLQQKYSKGNPKNKAKQGEVRANDERELYKHILMTEKYNFNDIEWGEYTHAGKNGQEPAMEVNQETGLRFPKKEGKNDDSFDEKYFTEFAYPYLQHWYIPMAMYSGNFNTYDSDESEKNGQFAYQIVSKAYSDILINKFVLEKKTNIYERYEYDIQRVPVIGIVSCRKGMGDTPVEKLAYTCTIVDTKPGDISDVDHVNTQDQLISSHIDETTQYKLIRAMTFDRAFKFEYEYTRYVDSKPDSVNVITNGINESPDGNDPYTGKAYRSGRQLTSIGDTFTSFSDQSGTYPIGHYSYKVGNKYITTKVWQDKLKQKNGTGSGEEYKVADVEDFINNKKFSDTTTTATGGGSTTGTLTPEQIKELAGSGMFVWPIPTQIGKWKKTYNDSSDAVPGTDMEYDENGVITSWVGYRIHPIYGTERDHDGLDIIAKTDADHTICAAKSGTVILAGWNGGYGNCVMIQHEGGYTTLYGHLSSILVSEGQDVTATQPIGIMGNTGASAGTHLHFEVKLNGERLDGSQFFNIDLTSVGGGTEDNKDSDKKDNNSDDKVKGKKVFIHPSIQRSAPISPGGASGGEPTSPWAVDGKTIEGEYMQLELTPKVIEYLKSKGVDASTYDYGQDYRGDWSTSNSNQSSGGQVPDDTAAFVSLHSNGADGNNRGQLYIYNDENGKKLGEYVTNSIHELYQKTEGDHGIQAVQRDDKEVNYSDGIPRTIVEVAYHDNLGDSRWMKENVDSIAQAIGDGIINFLKNAKLSPSGSGSNSGTGGYIKLTDKAREYFKRLEDEKKLDRLDFINATKDIFGKYVPAGQEYDENVGFTRGALSYSYTLLQQMLSEIGDDPDNLPFVYGQSLGLNTKHVFGFNGSGSTVGFGIFQWPLPEQVGIYNMTDADSDPNGVITSWFGARTNPVTGVWQKAHGALDIAPRGYTKICAAASGTVVLSEYYGGYGNCVIIDHGNGYWTLYGHMLNAPPVSVGQQVAAGQEIGTVGSTGNSTGPHLHFEIRKDANTSDARIDPVEFFNEDLTAKGGGAGENPNIEGSDVERWRPYVQQALAEVKANTGLNIPQTDDAVRRTLAQIKIESGGDPAAINRWDSNASFDCSIGLIQCISTTFNAYCRPGVQAYPVVGNNPIDPNDGRLNGYENIYACIHYCAVNYGEDLSKWPTSGGY